MSWPNKVYSRSLVPIYTKYNDTNMLFRYSGAQRARKYLDSTINANNSAALLRTNGSEVGGVSLVSDTSYVNSPITGTILSAVAADHSMAAFIRVSIPVANSRTVFGKGVLGAWSFYPSGGISARADSTIVLTWYDGGADYNYLTFTPPSFSMPYHVLYVLDHTNDTGYLYVNGFLAISNNPLNITAGAAYVAEPYRLGVNGSTITTSTGGFSIKDCTLWSRALIAADVRKEWLQYARMAQLKAGWGSKVSIANENTAGNFVGNGSTPFEILSGTWKVSTQTVDGELHKVIECVAAGTVWLDRKFMGLNSSEAAYGSWRGLFYHAPSATPTTVGLTATAKNTPSVTTGYYLRGYDAEARFGRYNAGTFTDLRTLPSPGAAIALPEFQVGRKVDNKWRTSARLAPGAYGPTWTDWQTSAEDTSATYLTSEGVSFTANAGDWLSLGTVRDNFAFTKFLGEFIPTEV